MVPITVSLFCLIVISFVETISISNCTQIYNETEQNLIDESMNGGQYSQDNLAKLLPSLEVVPKYAEVSSGSIVQLICATSDLDPDPEPSDLQWSFEFVGSRRTQLLHSPPSSLQADRMPNNVSILGNALVIWSYSPDEHSGFYKCSMNLPQSNLTVQASGELTARPAEDSAPLVFVTPELLQLSPNGSTIIKCEASGYPAPELSWYRVDGFVSAKTNASSATTNETSNELDVGKTNTTNMLPELDDIGDLVIEKIAPQDAMIYCEHIGCHNLTSLRSSGSSPKTQVKITAISLIRIQEARAQHRGQYVCRASNKHGSNQASMLVEVPEPEKQPTDKVSTVHSNLEKQINALGEDSSEGQAQNKTAKIGSNIELKCQVHGVEQPATSWSREGKELPNSSVQIERNLWIRNVSEQDSGLYLCLARSMQPNQLIQAKINLLVGGLDDEERQLSLLAQNLNAKIVASKSHLFVGDSVTLECILSSKNESLASKIDIHELERNVIWTNLNSSDRNNVFQDNVYIQNNLLIIYDSREENAAGYRCNYNNLSQHVDFNLQVSRRANETELQELRPVKNCIKSTVFGTVSSVWFQPQAYLQFRFNRQEETLPTMRCNNTTDTLDSRNFDKLSSMKENQNITFRLQTKSSYGLLLYIGQSFSAHENNTLTSGSPRQKLQASKSMIANLLVRLGSGSYSDFLALALVDGYVELSYELGSGLAIIRSSCRVNDGESHSISALRDGKLGKLIVDGAHKYEGQSPGKLDKLNVGGDIYLGGLPTFALSSPKTASWFYLSGFSGCLSSLEMNSLGPMNLISSNHLTQVVGARNLAPCSPLLLEASQQSPTLGLPANLVTTTDSSKSRPRPTTTTTMATGSDSDDSDEM